MYVNDRERNHQCVSPNTLTKESIEKETIKQCVSPNTLTEESIEKETRSASDSLKGYDELRFSFKGNHPRHYPPRCFHLKVKTVEMNSRTVPQIFWISMVTRTFPRSRKKVTMRGSGRRSSFVSQRMMKSFNVFDKSRSSSSRECSKS